MVVIKIAIVENEEYYVKALCEILKRWRAEEKFGCEVHMVSYPDGEAFLNSKIEEYHIVFMDIELDGRLNGIEAAKKLREHKIDVPLVFLTSYKEYIGIGYKVRALNYIVKPISYEDVRWCMEQVWESISDGCYIAKCKDGDYKIRYNDIIYIESSRHNVQIITADKVYIQKIAMKNLIQLLPKQFRQCHRTLIVNMSHIRSIHLKEIKVTGGTCLPVSTSYADELKKAYLGRIYV